MRLLLYSIMISLCIACSKDRKPEIISFTANLISERDSSEVYEFDILAEDDNWVSGIKVTQISNNEIVTTFSTLFAGAPTSGFGRTFETEIYTTFELKAEVTDDDGNVAEKVIQID